MQFESWRMGLLTLYLKDVSHVVWKRLEPAKVHREILQAFTEERLPCSRGAFTVCTEIVQTGFSWTVYGSIQSKLIQPANTTNVSRRQNVWKLYYYLEQCSSILVRLLRRLNLMQPYHILCMPSFSTWRRTSRAFNWYWSHIVSLPISFYCIGRMRGGWWPWRADFEHMMWFDLSSDLVLKSDGNVHHVKLKVLHIAISWAHTDVLYENKLFPLLCMVRRCIHVSLTNFMGNASLFVEIACRWIDRYGPFLWDGWLMFRDTESKWKQKAVASETETGSCRSKAKTHFTQ